MPLNCQLTLFLCFLWKSGQLVSESSHWLTHSIKCWVRASPYLVVNGQYFFVLSLLKNYISPLNFDSSILINFNPILFRSWNPWDEIILDSSLKTLNLIWSFLFSDNLKKETIAYQISYLTLESFSTNAFCLKTISKTYLDSPHLKVTIVRTPLCWLFASVFVFAILCILKLILFIPKKNNHNSLLDCWTKLAFLDGIKLFPSMYLSQIQPSRCNLFLKFIKCKSYFVFADSELNF